MSISGPKSVQTRGLPVDVSPPKTPGDKSTPTSQTPVRPRMSPGASLRIESKQVSLGAIDETQGAPARSDGGAAVERSSEQFQRWVEGGDSKAVNARDRFVRGLDIAVSTGDTRELLPPLAAAPDALVQAQSVLKGCLEDHQQELLGKLQGEVTRAIQDCPAASTGAPASGQEALKALGLKHRLPELEQVDSFLRLGSRNNLSALSGAMRGCRYLPKDVVSAFNHLIADKRKLMGELRDVQGRLKLPAPSQAPEPDISLSLPNLNTTSRRQSSIARIHSHLNKSRQASATPQDPA